MVSRRARLRAQTSREIEEESFAIIDVGGVHALSIAALARAMAMSAPAVYRYFPSRDALVARLTTQSYQQLATAISQAVAGRGRAPRAQVGLLVAAYRDWALRHRRRYSMLFGERPADAPGDVAARTPLDEAMSLLIDLLAAIVDPASGEAVGGDPALDGQLRLWARAQERPDTAPQTARAAILLWTRVHGIVSLELAGVFVNQAIDVQRLIDLEIDDVVRSLGRNR